MEECRAETVAMYRTYLPIDSLSTSNYFFMNSGREQGYP